MVIMKIASLALALMLGASPLLTHAQESGVVTDEQILIKQVQADKRAVYAKNLGLTDGESRAFWPVYDDYEAKSKKLDDRFAKLIDNYASSYDKMSDAEAAGILKEKMAIERDRMSLKQTYTAKIAKVLPAKKALRYAQLETRIETLIRSQVYGIIPLAR